MKAIASMPLGHLWRTRWRDHTNVPHKFLVADPTIQLPGIDLSRGHLCLLNRFRTEAYTSGACFSAL